VEALARLGRVDEATARSIEILESSGHQGTQFLRYYLPRILRAAGFHEQARRLAEVGVDTFSRIERVRPDYLAATLVCAGRYDEAREVLARPEDLPVGRAEAFSTPKRRFGFPSSQPPPSTPPVIPDIHMV